MALCNKLIGGHMTSMLTSFRSMSTVGMSTTRLFVGGLPLATTDQTLRDAFSSFGHVLQARVILDRESGRSKGFGFVSFRDEESASLAASSMNGVDLGGLGMRVQFASAPTSRPGGGGGPPTPRSGGGGYGRGGGSGSGYGRGSRD